MSVYKRDEVVCALVEENDVYDMGAIKCLYLLILCIFTHQHVHSIKRPEYMHEFS
jgi:hypothetical protein